VKPKSFESTVKEPILLENYKSLPVKSKLSEEKMVGLVPVVDNNWDFEGIGIKETQYSTHFFHHWAAKFIPQIPQNIIRKYGKTGDIVLDPFAGCGTTLVEAKLLGCPSYGIDISPLAIRICRAKVEKIDDQLLDGFQAWLDHWNRNYQMSVKRGELELFGEERLPDDPTLFEGSDTWFRSDVAKCVKWILQKIRDFDPNTKNFIEVSLSDLLKGMSHARSDRTVPSLPKNSRYFDKKHERWLDNQMREINVFKRLSSQLKRMSFALEQFHRRTNDGLMCRPILDDARHLAEFIPEANIVVTSPPYWSAQNYQKLHYLSFKLLGLSEPGEKEIGRNASDYLNDMDIVVEQISKILGGVFAIVIGESKENVHEQVKELILAHGMKEIESIKRTISNHTFFAKAVQQEFIYVFKNHTKRWS
jgi:DNA modification methylase